MSLFNRGRGGERLPAFISTECMGENCPNFNSKDCTDAEMEWMTAGGPTKKRNKSKPPLKDEATYIIYGQRCLSGTAPELVAQRVEVYKPEEVNTMQLIAQTGMYGDMPVQILNNENLSSGDTITGCE